ncbi:MAG: hypothetical protein WC596_00165 [Candidatus Shapirobacteria bacterium]
MIEGIKIKEGAVVLVGAGGRPIELPTSTRAVPKSKRLGDGAPMEGIVPNGTFGTGGKGLTIGEMAGQEDIEVTVAEGQEFLRTAEGTSNTVIVAEEMPARRNLINLRRHGL